MAVNSDKPQRWKEDIRQSVDLYNDWFIKFAPETFRATRKDTTGQVEAAFAHTSNLAVLRPDVLTVHPEILPILRMSTCPPIARDRLIGLSGAPPQLVKCMEIEKCLPPRMPKAALQVGLSAICRTIELMIDPDIVVWRGSKAVPASGDVNRAATIIADRLCGAQADPIIRNAQERRQLAAVGAWLTKRGYRQVEPKAVKALKDMPKGTYAFRLNVPVAVGAGGDKRVNVPIDVAVKPLNVASSKLPLMIEAKSAGDFTNVNKRRKEEATKMAQLRATYGDTVMFSLFLCGYFDSGYLGYEAAEGIDWVWEHRIDDLAELGL